MALKVDYVVRETTTNLRRNITLTIAAIVTIAVSLSLFGGAMLIRGGIDNMSTRWEDDVAVAVFIDREISEEQQDSLEQFLAEQPEIEDSRLFDREATNDEFERLFERSETMMSWLEDNPDGVPLSYRVVPRTVERDAVKSLTDLLEEQPGVIDATSSVEGVEEVERLSNSLRTAIFVVAVGLLVAAVLLILNAIRMAMFARRREIEVMKLVGATNWFIRVPFMMEGVVQGMIGAVLAIGSIKLIDSYMARVGTQEPGEDFTILAGFVAPTSTVTFVMVLIVLMGMIIGAIGSGIAISRFLRI